MTERQQQLLRLLVESYIASAEPVSSQWLAQASRLGVSSATIRNDLVALEEGGYVRAPHTSAGRVPTEQGYRYYIQSFVQNPTMSERDRRALEDRTHVRDQELRLCRLAQALSVLTQNVVVLSLAPERSYTTGISYLLAMPEFHDYQMIVQLGAMLDARDQWLAHLRRTMRDDIAILLGAESPFGEHMASMTLVYEASSGDRGLVSIIGPMRMNYERNLGVLNEVKRLIERV